MRILYGVVGEGMGHATRSRVVLEHLVKEHEVQVVASGRAQAYLSERFLNVRKIWGFTLAYEKNEVRSFQTLLQNLKGAVRGWPENIRRYFELAEEFAPDVVVSDFESFSYLFAKNRFLPVISVDNMQIINRCRHEPSLLAGWEDSFELTRSIVKAKLPGAFHYLVSTFFEPPLRKERTTLVPPILRKEILEARPETGEHLLVYQTATTYSDLPLLLRQCGIPCRVYGFRRDLTEDVVDGSITYRPFAEGRFIDDLRTARAVVAGGGFTLMSESVFLHKPMLSVPIAGQFEQVLNALYLEREGFGAWSHELSLPVLRAFLERLSEFERSLSRYRQDGNRRCLRLLDEQLGLAKERRGTGSEVSVDGEAR